MRDDPADHMIHRILKDNVLLGNGTTLDTPIYRTLPISHLVPDLLTRRLTLSRIIGWEDTHEGAYFNRSVEFGPKREPTGLYGLVKDWFGQCWSTVAESDALWRIYNKDGWSVRIQSTPRELVTSLIRSLYPRLPWLTSNLELVLYLGLVTYLDESEYKAKMEAPLEDVLTSDGLGMAKMLLVKRQAFVHEAELRLLFQSRMVTNAGKPVEAEYFDANSVGRVEHGGVAYLPMRLRLPFDWARVHDVMIGPRVDPGGAEVIRQALQRVAPTMSVTTSTLYGKPHLVAS